MIHYLHFLEILFSKTRGPKFLIQIRLCSSCVNVLEGSGARDGDGSKVGLFISSCFEARLYISLRE